MDPQLIQALSLAGSYQECLQACQNSLQGNPEDTYAYKYAGKSLLALGQFEKAQQCLVKAHQLDSKDPETIKDIGNTFLNLGNKDAAAQWYEKALGLNNNYAPAVNNLANLKRQSGNQQEAIDLFMRAIHADPTLIQAYVGAAASFLAIGDLDQAELYATQALEVNESASGTNEILGIISQNKSKPDQAIEYYQKELRINPQASNSLLNLGLLLLQKGQIVIAVESLAKASALAPSVQCTLLLAQAYQNLGLFQKAIVEYEKLDINQSSNKLIPFNLGVCFLNTGNNTAAIEVFKIAVHLDEAFVSAWGNIGTALMNESRYQEALTAMQKVLALDPDNATAHMNLGGIYKELGNLDLALVSTLKSLELNPHNPDVHMNLGGIYKQFGNLDQALASTLKSLELKPDNPDAHINLGSIYQDLGNLDQALASTLKSLELKPDNPDALINLGGIYKNLGNLEQSLSSTLRSLELKPDNPTAHMNLGSIHQDLGNLNQALASTLESLSLKPYESKALCTLGRIKMAQGDIQEAKKNLLESINSNPNECEAYYALSILIDSREDAEELVESIQLVSTSCLTPASKSFIEFAMSNCFHKLNKYDRAAVHLKIANDNNLIAHPSNADTLQQVIASSLSCFEPAESTIINNNCGEKRIFIVGMPRSGSTLLEVILSMNPEVKDLGESRSLEKAIKKIKQQEGRRSYKQRLDEIYSKMHPIDDCQMKYTVDKNLYNYVHISWIAASMPAAKIIHCCRNPMDNILSMYRSSLAAGNDYTSSLEDAARVLIAHEQAMRDHKKRYPEKVFTFDYDQFVNAPEVNLSKLLEWLELEFDQSYLHPEQSKRIINTASVMQARKPISNKSVGGWKNYSLFLEPARKLLLMSNLFEPYSLGI